MAAPNATLLAALRSLDRPARHMFFKMAHSEGDVLAWDGLGNRAYDGDTYTGIGAMASISGASQSKDLQNPEVVVTLNGVPYDALQSVDPTIRNVAANVDAAWYSEDGTEIASRRIFTGFGNYLSSGFGERSLSVSAHLRGRLADLSRAPQSYYTSAEQERLYSGDTGFDYVKTLENTTVSGWGKLPESTGAVLNRRLVATDGTGVNSMIVLFPTLALGGVYGNDTSGAFFLEVSSTVYVAGNNTIAFVTETAGAGVTISGANVLSSSVAVYGGVDGFARSGTTGQRIKPATGAVNLIRLATPISALGTATATTFAPTSGVNPPGPGAANNQVNFMAAGGGALSSSQGGVAVWKNVAYVNSDGRPIFNNSGTVVARLSGVFTNMVEEISGNAVTVSGGLMKCNGADVVLSTTGVLLTNAGRRIIPTGGTPSTDFARVWT